MCVCINLMYCFFATQRKHTMPCFTNSHRLKGTRTNSKPNCDSNSGANFPGIAELGQHTAGDIGIYCRMTSLNLFGEDQTWDIRNVATFVRSSGHLVCNVSCFRQPMSSPCHRGLPAAPKAPPFGSCASAGIATPRLSAWRPR